MENAHTIMVGAEVLISKGFFVAQLAINRLNSYEIENITRIVTHFLKPLF